MTDPVQPDSDEATVPNDILEIAQLLHSRSLWGKLHADPDDWYGDATDDDREWDIETAKAVLALARHPQQEAPGDEWEMSYEERVVTDGGVLEPMTWGSGVALARREVRRGPWLPVDDKTQEAGA